ncbi:MAG: hypothetical protein AAF529_01150 [Pseudomonadota bacterium]
MSEATAENSDAGTPAADAAQASEARTKNLTRLKRIGAWHATAISAALTLWGTANFWAVESSLLLAQAVALGNAIAAGTVIASILHEWGHYAGARLAGANAPVLAKPRRLYFMFDFDMQANSKDQFLSMSLGGIIANWAVVLVLLVLIPLTSLAAALLVAVTLAKAVNVSLFEVPIVMQVREGAEPETALNTRLKEYGLRQTPGWLAGLLAFLALT